MLYTEQRPAMNDDENNKSSDTWMTHVSTNIHFHINNQLISNPTQHTVTQTASTQSHKRGLHTL